MKDRLRNLMAVTPEVAQAARWIALATMGLAAFVFPLRAFFFVALLAMTIPGVAAGVVRLVGIPILCAVVVATTWLWTAGSYAPVRDGLLLAGIAIAMLVRSADWRRWWVSGCSGRSPRFDTRGNSAAAVVVLVSFWLASSGLDVWAVHSFTPPPASADRFRTLTSRPSRFAGKKAAVALSGGGYRAALVHAGVLYALEDLGVQVSAISSVSGGSIIGAYYASGGAPLDFLYIMQQRAFGLARELTRAPAGARALSWLLISGTPLDNVHWMKYDRTDAQAALLDRVFLHGVRLRDFDDDARPRLLLATTDTLTGRAVGFTSNGIYAHEAQSLFDRTSIDGKTRTSAAQSRWIPPLSLEVWEQPVARFVAASGAFPGALSPVSETVVVTRSLTRDVTESFRLADGGLTDNTGLTLLLVALTSHRPPDFIPGHAAWKPWAADVVIASDGGRGLEGMQDAGSGLFQDLSRASDVVYASAGLRFVSDPTQPTPPLSVLTPAESAFRSPSWLNDANPKGCEMLMHGPRRAGQPTADELTAAIATFRRTPTLADRFDPEDARLLFRLGQFLVARQWSGIWYALDPSPDSNAHVGPSWREVQRQSPCRLL